MSDSFLSFNNSSNFRNQLITRNLPPYNVPGTFSSTQSQQNYETNLSVSNVIDSSNDLIATNELADTLYPLNEYGPEGGYDGKYTVPGAPYPVDSNSGPYSLDQANVDLVNEFFIDAAYVQNIYGPEGGYEDLVIITDVVGPDKIYQPYWDPSSFVPSSYTPYDILFENDPTGSNGPLSQDTYLAKIGAEQLKSLFEDRIAAELVKNTIGRVNLDTLQDPFTASLIATGKEPLIEKNWTISQPENPIGAAASFATRLTGTYFPVSPIPGDYFNDTNIQAPLLEKGLNVANNLTGGLLGPILDVYRDPSETFVANTGNGQRSILFSTLDYNKYRPSYNRGILQSVTTGVGRLIDGDKPNTAGYYVGSKNSEPSQIDSPANELPIGPNGRQINTKVYGPQELGLLYEGNNQLANNSGLGGKSLTDGGGIAGQFVWTSPKYKDNAGFKQGPGGVPTTLDNEFAEISSDYLKYQSTDVSFKEGSILDQTQRLVESGDKVAGGKRLKHVGNAINQVSKVFNDGYKEMTKGSKVLSYKNDSDGTEAGIEYCRVFTKDTPYYTYADLQKSDGITTEGRKFTYSVFDKTYNLNIAPLKNPGSTNIIDNKVKKYMLSLENLAWRTSDRPGFTYDDLPVCERGPNGGRIMWFPPYDLKFSDDSTPSWNPTKFLGRPEPIYTYQNTDRKGTLSFKIVVDHPSVINTIVQKQLKSIPQERVDSMVDSFYAGCLKYDLYELGIKFNTIPTRDLFTYQQVLNNPRLTDEELGQVAFEIPVDAEINATGGGDANEADSNDNTNQIEAAPTPDPITLELDKYNGYGFYFDNDCPECTGSVAITASAPYPNWYNQYTSNSKYNSGSSNIPSVVKTGDGNIYSGSAVPTFLTDVVKGNYSAIQELMEEEIGPALAEGGTVSFTLVGSASPIGSVSYNEKLSKRRINSAIQWIETLKAGEKTFKEYIDEKKLNITETPKGEEITIPKSEVVDEEGNKDVINYANVNCTKDIKRKTSSGNFVNSSSAQVYSVPAMACRRVLITELKGTKPAPIPPPPPTPTPVAQTGGGGDNEDIKKTPSDTIKPSPNLTIEQKIKDGISKKILRFLFSECDYFEVLKDTDPMVFQSMKDKLKHFNPAFHSMTPEGLNSRLTFLNQCVRPGQTIPVIGPDGRPKYNDALNTSFGAPPILVLRVGDFYHSKIVPESVAFTYDDPKFDINPEGIGLQPMIANVSINFKFIGGHGLKNPVEELQNALSFNFYANTEVYDERATPTEDTSARDKYVVEQILAGQPPIKTVEVDNQIPKKGGETIGSIISDTEIDYTSKINDFWEATKKYFEAYVDTNIAIRKNFNIGIQDLLFVERDYVKGNFDEYNEPLEIEIYGKPKDVEDKVNKLFGRTLNDVSKDKDPFMSIIVSPQSNLKNSDKREVRRRLKSYITNMLEEFSLNLNNEYTPFINLQQEYIQYIRQFNLILTKTDGSLDSNDQAKVYDLSGDTVLNEIKLAVNGIKEKHTYFNEQVVEKGDLLNLRQIPKEYTYNKLKSTFVDQGGSEFTPPEFAQQDNTFDEQNRFYQVMGNVFYLEEKRNQLKEFLLNSTVYKEKDKTEKAIDRAIEQCVGLYNGYTLDNNAEYQGVFKDEPNERYIESIAKPITIREDFEYKINYIQTEDGTNQQKRRITNLYSKNNINNKRNTFDGKVKFN